MSIRERITPPLQQWLRLANYPDKVCEQFVQHLHKEGHIASDEALTAFLRSSGELVVEACLKTRVVGDSKLNYQLLDNYSHLLFALVKHGHLAPSSANKRLEMLTRILTMVVRLTLSEHEAFKSSLAPNFDQRPYYRLLLNLLLDMNAPDAVLDARNVHVLNAFAGAFHQLRPAVAPAFAFGWLELVSHRNFMPEVLQNDLEQRSRLMLVLLMDMLSVLEPHLARAELNDAMRMLYKGVVRVFLVLLHDFPQFLCDYHLSFCDAIPPNCVQLRNLVLSAFPRSMRLPDPLTPNLKVDRLPEITQAPRILSDYRAELAKEAGLKEDLDTFLATGAPINFLPTLPGKLRIGGPDGPFNVPLINSLVVTVGVNAIAVLQDRPTQSGGFAPMHLFNHLATHLEPEGRYHLLNAIANQLRYPNNHTHYFSYVMLHLFASAERGAGGVGEQIREQITRVLLDRVVVHRPHPWGLLITFIELLKNRRYAFWSNSFVRGSPEIEQVFRSVAGSALVNAGAAASGGGGSADGTDDGSASTSELKE